MAEIGTLAPSAAPGKELDQHHFSIVDHLGPPRHGEAADKYEATATGPGLAWCRRRGHARLPVPHLTA